MITRVLKHPALMVAAAIAACWPVWAWYAERMVRFPEQRAVLAPLALAVAIIAARPGPRGATAHATGPVVGSLLLYAATFHFVPPLIRALFAVVVLGVAINAAARRRRLSPGVLLLLALALPIVPTAQFYLGFPLRVIAGEAASWMLTISGYDVSRSGTILDWGGRLVAIDAACSGVRMLWTGLFVAAAIAAARDFGWWQTVVFSALAMVSVIVGNVIRTVALFFPEARLVHLPSWAHEGIGVLCFAVMVTMIILMSRARFIARSPCSAA